MRKIVFLSCFSFFFHLSCTSKPVIYFDQAEQTFFSPDYWMPWVKFYCNRVRTASWEKSFKVSIHETLSKSEK